MRGRGPSLPEVDIGGLFIKKNIQQKIEQFLENII
jgi:hypothetical protein